MMKATKEDETVIPFGHDKIDGGATQEIRTEIFHAVELEEIYLCDRSRANFVVCDVKIGNQSMFPSSHGLAGYFLSTEYNPSIVRGRRLLPAMYFSISVRNTTSMTLPCRGMITAVRAEIE